MSQSATPVPTQAQAPPKVRGGFEVDDDEDVGYNEVDQDADDVYDPEISLQVNDDPSGSVDAVQIDRTSQSPEQNNGITPAPLQADDNPADSSSVFPNPSELRTSSVTPAQAAATLQTSPGANLHTPVVSNAPKARLAHDVIGILEDRIKDDPRGDIASWLELIEEFKSRNKDTDVRETYNRFFEYFPTAADQWAAFARWEDQNENRIGMERVFNASLLKVPNVALWSIYIDYIRRRNSMQTGDTSKAYKIIDSAFSFCLQQIGIDKDSGRLWQDYIEFLKNGPHNINPNGTWEDKAKVDKIREEYQKALSVPTSALLTLWKEYDAFETGMNRITGRKFLQERSPAYMTARTAFTQLQNLTKDLQRTTLPRLPPAHGYDGDTEYAQQVILWKQWVDWEKEDNLVLKDDDLDQYKRRIVFTYKQALMALQFWPEMWYEAAEFCFLNDLQEEGMKFLNDGFKANPESALLAFKLADRIESDSATSDNADPGSKERMRKVRQPYNQVLDALYGVEKKTDTRMQAEIQKVENEANATNGDASADDDLNASNVASRKAMIDARIQSIRSSTNIQLDMLSKIISHAWIALMRATRRIQGKGLPNEKGAGFRTIFNEARKRGRLTSDFYVESAQIEWQCYRDPTGTRILERGVKLFPEDNYLPLEYIKHLVSKDDLTNARAVFETTVNRFLTTNSPVSVAKTKPLFAFFHDYESKYGELSQIERLESRMSELFPEDPSLKQFSARYSTTTFDPLNVHPIISNSQTVPKSTVAPSYVELNNAVNSPIQNVIDSITTNSPKRPLEDSEDIQPRKMIRAESPLKGAAGRRMNQQQRLSSATVPQFPPPPPLPPQVLYMLSILPKSSAYTDVRLDPLKIFELIRDIHLPPPGRAPQPQASSAGWPAHYPPAQQTSTMPQGYAPPVGQTAYSTEPFRYP